MAYKAKSSNCKICAGKFLQTREANVLCPKAKCKTANRKLLQKEYGQRARRGETTTKGCNPKITDASTPKVRFNNIFILGQLNTCNTELVKLSLS